MILKLSHDPSNSVMILATQPWSYQLIPDPNNSAIYDPRNSDMILSTQPWS